MGRVRALAVLGLLSLPGLAGARDHRSLWLYNVHTGEELRVEPFGDDGIPLRGPWNELNRFWRSWRTGKEHTVAPRLLRTLAQIQRHFGGVRLDLVSGCRAPDDVDHLTSYHQVGHASDIHIAGVPNRELFDYCRSLDDLGCGLYPNMDFVHVDVRSTATIWVDVGTEGNGRKYVDDPARWLLEHPDAGR